MRKRRLCAYTAICKSDGVNPEVIIWTKIAIEISVFDLLEGSKVCKVAQISLYGFVVSDFPPTRTLDFHYEMRSGQLFRRTVWTYGFWTGLSGCLCILHWC